MAGLLFLSPHGKAVKIILTLKKVQCQRFVRGMEMLTEHRHNGAYEYDVALGQILLDCLYIRSFTSVKIPSWNSFQEKPCRFSDIWRFS